MKIVLDTNVLSEIMKPQGSKLIYDWVAAQPRKNLFTTSINEAEILYGIAILPRGQRSQSLTNMAQMIFTIDFAGQILNFDSSAAEYFAEIAATRKKIGKPISEFDTQIAAICLANNAAIATRNVNDFVNCQITVINPWNFS